VFYSDFFAQENNRRKAFSALKTLLFVFSYIVTSYEDVQSWIEVGNRQRATASTGMNDKSSRSHSVFTLNLVQTTVSREKAKTPNKMFSNLVACENRHY